MPIIDIITLFIGLITIIFPIILYLRNRKSTVNKSLLLLSFVAGPIWSISIWLYNQSFSSTIDLLALQGIYLVAIFTAFLTYWLTSSYPYKTKFRFWEIILVFGVGMFFIYQLLFTNNFINEIVYTQEGVRTPILGTIYIVWFFWFTVLFLWRIIQMRQTMLSLGGIEKKQMVYVISGFTIVGFGVVPTNLVIPYFGNFNYIWIGPIFIAIMINLITYGISTTRFINFKNLIQETYFLIIAIIVPLLLSLFCFLLLNIFFTNIYYSTIPSLILLSIFSYLIIKKYYENMKDLSTIFLEKTSTQLKLKDLGQSLSKVLKENVQSKKFDYKIIDKSNSVIYSYRNDNKLELILLKQFWSYYNDYTKPIILAELEYLKVLSIEENNIWKYKRFIGLIEYLNSFNWQIILPLQLEDNYFAIIFIGNNTKNIIYSNNEVNSILSLTSAIKITLDRGLLHRKTEDFNKSLQQKVSEQTFELEQKVKELEEARRKESDMIDIMGHELRTPMSVIKINVDLLHSFLDKVNERKEDFKKYLSRIKDSVETEIRLINTLLSTAKLEGDKIELNLEKVDINKDVEMSIHAHEKEAQEKGLEIITKLYSNNPMVYADHARVMEILNNLISNAIKYTREGSVTVKTQIEEEFVRVSVIDTGEGISKEDLKNIGTKFYRTGQYIGSNNGRLDIVRPGGTGLGLYVVFNLIERMGGTIDVESEIGKGSIFSFTLQQYLGQEDEETETDNESNDMFTKLGLKK